jgi:hypothetical protein
MIEPLHLGDPVEVITNNFADQGAPRGSIGVIVDDWADGSNDVEVSDEKTGEVVARFRAAADEIEPYAGPVSEKHPRHHGIIFGRGDELADDVEPPPQPDLITSLHIPGYTPASLPFSQPPPEEVDVVGDVPWELQDEPPTGPIFH